MSDREGYGGNDDLSLPKATVQKIITEILSNDSGVAFAREARDLLIDCCLEFVQMVSSQANEIAEKEAKKTIACEHVTGALDELGFSDYIPELLKVAQEYKVQQAGRERKQDKIAQSGMTEEELIRQQEELFRSATDKFNAAPQT
ncbi:histone-fold-containing protein [Rhizodiscina lignyota]|uniref:NCT transcriptional regulatory complex subunit B n=1 Tax=Rhizodiscina lignyota TaxID=1504668 RepID=A0A9P4IC25_9PEZI|nr:histone-fold-containing protein [Rhizodiscina lignyota]